jgi:hypothetical protein
MSKTTWPVGSLVRVREGRGTVFSLRGATVVVKLLGSGRKVTVLATELQTGRVS